MILSASTKSRKVSVWGEQNSKWEIVQNIILSACVRKMCFNKYGTILAAIGKELFVWSCSVKKETGTENL